MSDIVCITARKLCRGDFLEQLEKIAEAAPKYIILREKDLSEDEYRKLAVKAADICSNAGCEMILHYFWRTAIELDAKNIHLPLPLLRELSDADKKNFERIGTSCHSVEDALEAQKLGADYITAGHVFATDCKKGLAPRGLDFLRDVCYSVDIPVYAIGGISPDNIASVRECGAAGACVMSGFMRCSDPRAYIGEFNGK
jgi:thiamine-phosphate pyrophosphorylase